MRATEKNKTPNLDVNNLSSRKMWELLKTDNSLSRVEIQQLTVSLRKRRHYDKELDALNMPSLLMH